MTASTKRVRRSEKLDLRLTASAKRSLQAAAELQHKSLTEFVLDSALTTAEAVLMEQRSIMLNAEQWKAFQEALDAPPRHHERLERLLTEPSVFD
jgi:uncharacterized protein (DUF1778 family)